MYKLLLVDDEEQIRKGLRHILPWEEYDIEICGDAENGKEGLERILEYDPQIIITDIKMPVMDGMEMMEKAKKSHIQGKFVVLSGYNDFALVRQAMKLGAVDYLLKPVGRSELLTVVEELLDELSENAEKAEGQQNHLENAREVFLNRLMRNQVSAIEYREKTEILELNIGKGQYAAACLFSGDQESDSELGKEIREILSVVNTYLQEKKAGFAFIDQTGEIVLLLNHIPKEEGILPYQEELSELCLGIRQKYGSGYCFSVGRSVHSYRGLSRSYEEALETQKYIYIFDEAVVLYTEEIAEYFRQNSEGLIIRAEQIEDLMKSRNEEVVKDFVETYFGKENAGLSEYYYLRNTAMESIVYLYHYLMKSSAVNRIQIHDEKAKVLKRLGEIRTLDQIKSYLLEVILHVCEQYQKNITPVYSKLVMETLEQIKCKYSDSDLSLPYLAETFNVNSAYLGRVFKKETGSSFVDYLNWYRVEKAEKLLRETNLKGSELCARVGFANYNYFYVVFKKLKGKKPGDVRISGS